MEDYRQMRTATIPSYSSNSTDLRSDGGSRGADPPNPPRQAFFPDSSSGATSFPTGGSRNVPKFVPVGGMASDPNNNDEGTKGARKRKLEPDREGEDSSRAAGKMGPGYAVFEDIYHDFDRSDPTAVRDRNAPPYAPRLSEGETFAMVEWERNKIRSRSRLREDKLWRFLQLFASFTGRNDASRLLTGPTRRFPGIGPGTSAGVAPRTFKTEFSPSKGSPQIPPLSPSSPPGSTTSQKSSPVPPPLATSLEDWRRLRSASGWLEEPDVIGTMDLSPEVYGHVMEAFTMITMKLPNMSELTSFEPFINTDVKQVASLFAKLSAMVSADTDFFFPTRNAFDANSARIERKIQGIIAGLGTFAWGGRDFVRIGHGPGPTAGSGTIYTPFPTTSTGLLFPRYSNVSPF